LTEFNDLELAKPILKSIDYLGYKTPSPIQAKMIPLLLEGQDVVGIAQTGTGKTAAFMLPLLTKLHELQRRPQKGKCDVLVLTPTRELANQILENARLYGKDIKFSACLIVGGARYEGQLRSLAKGVNLIVATPGRLMDHMETGAVDLSEVSYVVLDEADQMLDMGFIPAVRTIMKDVPEARQTVMTSATMPQQVEKLAREMMINPARIAVSKQSEPAKNIKQHILFVDKPQKPKALLATLSQSEWDKVIIFTRTKRGADKTQVQLIKAGYMAQSLHGDKSFGQTRHILEEFKSGEVSILVATDLAGRGLDIDDISLVINYDIPNVAESYVHRIGRTGRAGRSGMAISLVDRSEKSYLKEIEKLMEMNLRDASGKAPIDLSIEPAALPQGQLTDKPYRADKPSARSKPADREERPARSARSDKPRRNRDGDKFNKGDKRDKREGRFKKRAGGRDKPRFEDREQTTDSFEARPPRKKPSGFAGKPRSFEKSDKDGKGGTSSGAFKAKSYEKRERPARDEGDRFNDKPRTKPTRANKPSGANKKRGNAQAAPDKKRYSDDKNAGTARLKRKSGAQKQSRSQQRDGRKANQASSASKKRAKSSRKSA